MILLGYEDPVAMPTMDVYNTDLMRTYIAGVKEQYDNARQDMKDFMKQYLDFVSSIPGMTQRVQDETVGAANKLINYFYSNGIDPFKSPEARNAISKFIATRDYTSIANIKGSEEAVKEFIKNRDALLALGKYDPKIDKALGGAQLEDYDPSKGQWTRTTPFTKINLRDVTNDFYKNLEKDLYLGPDPKDSRYNLWGVRDDVLAERDKDATSNAIMQNKLYWEKIWKPEALRRADEYNAAHKNDKNHVDLTAEDMFRLMSREANADTWSQPKDELDPDKKDARDRARDWVYTLKEEALKHEYFKKLNPGKAIDDPNYRAPGGGDSRGSSFLLGMLSGAPHMIARSNAGASDSDKRSFGDLLKSYVNWWQNYWGTNHGKKDNKYVGGMDVEKRGAHILGAMLINLTPAIAKKFLGDDRKSDGGVYTLIKTKDINRIYTINHIESALNGSSRGSDASRSLWQVRDAIKSNLNNGGSCTFIFNSVTGGGDEHAVVYENKNGIVHVMMPIKIVERDNKGKKLSSADRTDLLLMDTGIYGTYDTDGNFNPDPKCRDKFLKLDNEITLTYAKKTAEVVNYDGNY